ncbi:RHS repeat-associated core domain-containing protein [Pyxidicoccus trucidator]|uniref:RHS repeat-associated core domain-containing protein n=1 Tax=Pyxidicoccus trucidator TaxID=2709662 RepID=UPI001F072DE3|nr:RHS repeat-associated core domain-containing protein [Pyxidicoccus trucidator]
MGLFVVLCPRLGEAQLAPTGGHYAGRASDTGSALGSVGSSGQFSASVPLDLPESRGGLPIPLSIGSAAQGMGAVGLGWDIPLSYIRRDTSFAHRRPAFGNSTTPQPRTQVTLSIQGQLMDLVPRGPMVNGVQEWVVRYDSPELLLREQNGGWVMYDGQGRTWTFVERNPTGLWLLDSISGPGGASVKLEYAIGYPVEYAGQAVAIDLLRVLYNKHPQTGCYKHEVFLSYDNTPRPTPLSLAVVGDFLLVRKRMLNVIDVNSRADCTSAYTRLRRYDFTYLPDADTQQPRLSTVRMLGRQGTPEQNVPLPVASFSYGSATTNGVFKYQKTQSIPQPAGTNANQISGTGWNWNVPLPVSELPMVTWQSLTDVTGDGRADLVYSKDDKLWVGVNRPGTGGTTLLGPGGYNVQLSDTTFTKGPYEVRSALLARFAPSGSVTNVDRVWRQAMDVNGDGRVDFIDAAEAAGKWVVYLNTPGTGLSGVKWERREYSIGPLYNRLLERGHSLSGNYLPLVKRYTGRNHFIIRCWLYRDGAWSIYSDAWNQAGSPCWGTPNELIESDEQTYTEWEVTDVNGDGFPDFVFNSSKVGTFPDGPPTENPQQVGGLLMKGEAFRVRPEQGTDNKLEAVLNVQGMLISAGVHLFSNPITLKSNTECGVGKWLTTVSVWNYQSVACGLADVNGDNLLDRVHGSTVSLGTGRGFSQLTLTLPGGLSVQKSDQHETCVAPTPRPPATTPFSTSHHAGMRDLTGDGIPDYVKFDSRQGTWEVHVGTGTGFAPPVLVEGSGFSYSFQEETCEGLVSSTRGGLYDLDGDGRPEVVRVNGGNLDVYQLAGGSLPGKPEAGRIVQVDNGYGSRTLVGYRSAKEDLTLKHQVPFPEIVVTSVNTTGTQGLGGTLHSMRYAYGGAELHYDSALQRFVMPGYQRTVALRTPGVVGQYEGFAVITDRHPIPAYTYSTKLERFSRYLLAGKVRDVTVLKDVLTDPWALLGVNASGDSRRLRGTHLDYAAKLFEEPAIPGTNGMDCLEMVYPYNYLASLDENTTSTHAYGICAAHGFMYMKARTSWRGTAAPPSTTHVATGMEVRDIDDYGRVLNVFYKNDLFRSDDDLCVETQYATPVGSNERMLHAARYRRSWYCDKTPYITYAAESYLYDGLPAGSVSAGRVTSHTRDRYDAAGTFLESVLAYTASYDALTGNLASVSTEREDGALRVTSLSYDPFALIPVEQWVTATGIPSLVTRTTLDAVSLAPLSTLDPNQTRLGTDYDGYGRPVRTTLTPPGGSAGVLTSTRYLGDSGTDPLGRRIVGKGFKDPVTPGTEASAPGRTGTVFLDELGRARRTEFELGADYANALMITGATTYDGFGRVSFMADPYPSTQSGATAYGTSYFFNADGSLKCTVRGRGPQANTQVPDAATERYPTCYSRAFVGNQEVLSVTGADALLTGSPQAGVTYTAALSATGRVLNRSTMQGSTRREYASFVHNRLGQLIAMTRYLDPVALTGSLQWTWTHDSFGRRLQWQEPESVPQTAIYSDWGELLELRWTDTLVSPSATYRLLSSYDALGRVKHQEQLKDGLVVQGTAYDFVYDVGQSPTSMVTPTYMLGRLSQTKSSAGDVYYSYDALGRANARSFIDSSGNTYVEKSLQHADGTLAALGFYLPDTDYEYEEVQYTYDSFNRMRTVKVTGGETLYQATEIDPFGRVRKAKHGSAVDSATVYADLGRRLMTETTLVSPTGSRRTANFAFDPVGRELSRSESSGGTALTTTSGYDALGRLTSSKRTHPLLTKPQMSWQFTYDPLGNLLGQNDLVGSQDSLRSYRAGDRDRVCAVGYGDNAVLSGCNVVHDGMGNIVQQPTRTGVRQLGYFPSGAIRSISELNGSASFLGDALGTLSELHLQGAGAIDARREWRVGGLFERREQVVNGQSVSVITRNIPGPDGIIASRRGRGDDWVFGFGETRGARYFTNRNGDFVQTVSYQPFGDATSSGVATPDTVLYSTTQWNDGNALAAFELVKLGERMYDPVLGRFLSRDPFFVPRTSATTNPYAFAMNDPMNLSDPSGLDVGCGPECSGGGGGGDPHNGGGGPSDTNPYELYITKTYQPEGEPLQKAVPPQTPNIFAAPGEPQTVEGGILKLSVLALTGIVMGSNFDYDTLAASGTSLEGAVSTIVSSAEGNAALVDAYNLPYDQWSTFFQNFGDSVWFWCPGCGENFRGSWGITSGTDDPAYATTGTIAGMGLGGMLTSIVKGVGSVSTSFRSPKPVPNRAQLDRLADKVHMQSNCRNCGPVAIAFDKAVAGKPVGVISQGAMKTSHIAVRYLSRWRPVGSKAQVEQLMRQWGPGSRGVIAARVSSPTPLVDGEKVGHVFNVVHGSDGIHFIDVANGSANFNVYYDFYLLRTQ